MTSPEDLLTSTLHERVDQHDVPTTPMSDVVSTAGRIKRHRRLRYAAVTAVVVGVLATPFALDAAHRSASSPTPSDPSPSPTEPSPHVRLADVALGDPPSVPWIDGSVYVSAYGTRTTLPMTEVINATPYRGGFLVAGYEAGKPRVTLLDDRMREVWRHCGPAAFAVSSDGASTAYATGACGSRQTTLHLGATDGTGEEQTQTMPLERAAPVGIIDHGVVTGSYRGGPSTLADFHGPGTPIDALEYASGVAGGSGLVSGQSAGGGPRAQSTGAVVDAHTGSVRWSKLGWTLLAFSPDQSMVVGSQLGTQGSGWGVFDAETGEKLHEFATPAGFTTYQVVWEDDEHLLMLTVQGRTEAILRSTLDGAIQRASETAPYHPNDPDSADAFRLAPQP